MNLGKTALITHTDMDGDGCAILAELVFSDKIDIYYANYNDVEDILLKAYEGTDDCKYDTIIMTDISIRKEVYQKITEENKDTRLIILDHHKTALELNEFEDCTVQIKRADGHKTCGTEMFYNWLREIQDIPFKRSEFYSFTQNEQNSIDYFVEYVREYDTFEWAEKGSVTSYSEQMNQIYLSTKKSKWHKQIIDEIRKRGSNFIKGDQLIVLEANRLEREKTLELLNKQLSPIELWGYKVGCILCSKDISWMGNKLSEMHPELDFILLFSQGKVSGRTVKDNIDLGALFREKCNGGGHPKAAGFEYDSLDFFTKLLK